MELKTKKGSSFTRRIAKGVLASTILVSSSLMVPDFPLIPGNEKVAHAAGPSFTVTADILNVRSGPGTNHAKIGRLSQGTMLDVIQRMNNGWYKISFNGKTAYVSGDYVYSSEVYRVNATRLHFRTGPGTQYKSMGLINNGTVLDVIRKESNGWYKISYKGKAGFVSGDYVTTSNAAVSKKMDIPVIAQRPELPSGCEVTSLAMALRYYGVNADKTTLAKQMPYDSTELVRNPDGSIKIWGDQDIGFVGTPFGNGFTINPGPLKKVLDKYRPGGLALTGKSFTEIESYVKQGKPVLVWFTINYEMPIARTWKTPAGKTINAARPLHNIVITGTDENYVYFNDSEAVKKDVRLPKAKFINIYNAMGKRALVVN